MSANGYIKMHRKTLESPVFTDGDVYLTFSAILFNVTRRNGVFGGIKLDAGQMAFSWRKLAERLHGGPAVDLEGKPYKPPSINTLRKRIAALERGGIIKVEPHQFRYSILTVCNWSRYQDGSAYQDADTLEDSAYQQADTLETPQQEEAYQQVDTPAYQQADTLTGGLPQQRIKSGDSAYQLFDTYTRSYKKGEGTEQSSDTAAFKFEVKAGKKSAAGTWELPQPTLARYLKTYSDKIDVAFELEKAVGYLIDRPEHRKTAGGMPRFLTGWLNRAVRFAAEDQSAGHRNGRSSIPEPQLVIPREESQL